VNVDTSEFRALTEQVERLTVIAEDQRVLIRAIGRLLGDDEPLRHSGATSLPPGGGNVAGECRTGRHLRAVDD
jgi:hypothetical protein